MAATIAGMSSDAILIRRETEPGKNTAERVGGLFCDIIEYLGNIDTSGSGSGGGGGSSFEHGGLLGSLQFYNNPADGLTNQILVWKNPNSTEPNGWGYMTTPTGSGGFDPAIMWGYLSDNTDNQITYNHLSDALGSITWWGSSIQTIGTGSSAHPGVVGSLTGVDNIDMSGSFEGTGIHNTIIFPNNIKVYSTPNGLCVDGNLYATGGVSALGIGEDGQGGGGVPLGNLLTSMNTDNMPSNANYVIVSTKDSGNNIGWTFLPYNSQQSTFNIAAMWASLLNDTNSEDYIPGYDTYKIDNEHIKWTDNPLKSTLDALSSTVSAIQEDYLSKDDAADTYLTIADFETLFEPQDANGAVTDHPYPSGITSIKAKFGLWTEQYLSALGISAGGSGYTFDERAMWFALGADPDDAYPVIDSVHLPDFLFGYWLKEGEPLSNNSVPVFNNGQWEYKPYSSSPSGDVTHADEADKATRLADNSTKSIWGNTYWSSGQPQNVNGNIQGPSNFVIQAENGLTIQAKETGGNTYRTLLKLGNDLSVGYGAYVGGFKTIVEGKSVTLRAGSNVEIDALNVDDLGFVSIPCPNDNRGLLIGDAWLKWDNTNNALKVCKYVKTVVDNETQITEQPANLYATGGISALGIPNDASGSVASANITTLNSTTVNTKNVVLGNGNDEYSIQYNINDDGESPDTKYLLHHTPYEDKEYPEHDIPEKTVLGNDSIDEVHGNKFFFDADHYLAYTTENIGGTDVPALRLYSRVGSTEEFTYQKVTLTNG